eukprot:TRINITY_DN6382_c0_g2_i2.p1 TRINITY_DN6382_c0_g2~~TRINITY_DN6382_c0_g2_i2.p1  ORF type:complete len:425 (+),score=50.40 TRINITY_DN6382_c0_g2_i2:66-1340(+)
MSEQVTESVLASWARAHIKNDHWDAPLHKGSANFHQEYQVGKLLGRGGFGEVKKAVHRATGIEVAVKIVHCQGEQSACLDEGIEREVKTMSQVTSPHTISVIEAFQQSRADENQGNPVWHIVLELCTGRGLSEILQESGALQAEALRAVTAQLAVAVLHMHSSGVAHGDIKPANIMVHGEELQGASSRIKLVDFGLACLLGEPFARSYTKHLKNHARANRRESKDGWSLSEFSPIKVYQQLTRSKVHGSVSPAEHTPVLNEMTPVSQVSRTLYSAFAAGSEGYASPELLAKANTLSVVKVPLASEAFSVGRVISHCATGVPPIQKVMDYISENTNLVASIVNLVRACAGKPVPRYCFLSKQPEEVRDIIKGLTTPEAHERMTITQLCQSPYVANAPGSYMYQNPFSASQYCDTPSERTKNLISV